MQNDTHIPPDVVKALHLWEERFNDQQEAAATAVKTAFPSLERLPPPTGCCKIRLGWEDPSNGSGTVCIDEHAQATVDFTELPQDVAGRALDHLFGKGWFDGTNGSGIESAPPGSYSWYDEATSADYEIKVSNGTASVNLDYIKVPDMVAVLAALQTEFTAKAAPGV